MDPQSMCVTTFSWLVIVALHHDRSFHMLDRRPTDINLILFGRSCCPAYYKHAALPRQKYCTAY